MKKVSSGIHAHGSNVAPYCGPEGPTAITHPPLSLYAKLVSCGGPLGPRDLGGPLKAAPWSQVNHEKSQQ